MKLSIIIPVYNEIDHIDEVVTRIHAVKLPDAFSDMEMILVDDGSCDGSTEKLEKYKGTGTMIVHVSGRNFGKGAAIRISPVTQNVPLAVTSKCTTCEAS